MSDRPEGLLAIRTTAEGDSCLVSLEGEMDGSNARDLEDELVRLEATDVRRIVLDLGSLEFIDSTGLAVIMRAHKRASDNGHRFGVRRPQPDVSRLFELCGLDKELNFVAVDSPAPPTSRSDARGSSSTP
jgi:anti-sigma B factor antagonist